MNPPLEVKNSLRWFSQKDEPAKNPHISPTRDVFEARRDRMYRHLSTQTRGEAEAAMVTSVVGEIGGNCFDHNLGQWRDQSGCWFEYGSDKKTLWIIISDRGQGVLSSLRRVFPTLENDQQALEMAFSKYVSGRSPERRGNGLKFVRSIINGEKNRGLLFLSGSGRITFGGLADTAIGLIPSTSMSVGPGTYALILWK